jgi:hypothetical protein
VQAKNFGENILTIITDIYPPKNGYITVCQIHADEA